MPLPSSFPDCTQVTFTKRKNGLLKKARELSILCDCDIAVLIFNNASGRCFEFSSDETSRTLTRFATYEGDVELRGLGEVRTGASRLIELRSVAPLCGPAYDMQRSRLCVSLLHGTAGSD